MTARRRLLTIGVVLDVGAVVLLVGAAAVADRPDIAITPQLAVPSLIFALAGAVVTGRAILSGLVGLQRRLVSVVVVVLTGLVVPVGLVVLLLTSHFTPP